VIAWCLSTSTLAVAVLDAGDVPPRILGRDIENDYVETGQYSGKVMMVTFWATWCGPCMKELPMLEAIQKVAGKDKLQVVAVNIEDRPRFRQVAKALSSLNIRVAHDSTGASRAFGVEGIPHCAIIGRDGKIIRVHRGYSESDLDSILAEINAALAAK
jgi:thiol-disulfide isomerase/thioredoxin